MAGPKFPPPRLSGTIPTAFITGLFFGIYLITVGFANRWLLFTDEGWKLRKQHHWSMIIITNIIWALLLADCAVAVFVPMLQMSFIEAGNKPREWANPPWNAIVKCTVANSIALLADIVLMYRLWFVYGQRIWILCFPVFLWVGGLVCTVLEIYLQVVHVHDPNFGPYQWASVNMNTGPGIVLIPFWLSTMVLNAYCTGLLIWKIWQATKTGNNGGSTKQLQFLIRILMESGILYLLVGLAHFFVWFGRNGFSVALLGTINTAVVAIAFNLVLIRTAQNKLEDEGSDHGSGEFTSFHFRTSPTAFVDIQGIGDGSKSSNPEEIKATKGRSDGNDTLVPVQSPVSTKNRQGD